MRRNSSYTSIVYKLEWARLVTWFPLGESFVSKDLRSVKILKAIAKKRGAYLRDKLGFPGWKLVSLRDN